MTKRWRKNRSETVKNRIFHSTQLRQLNVKHNETQSEGEKRFINKTDFYSEILLNYDKLSVSRKKSEINFQYLYYVFLRQRKISIYTFPTKAMAIVSQLLVYWLQILSIWQNNRLSFCIDCILILCSKDFWKSLN